MDWIRGGDWEFHENDEGRAVARLRQHAVPEASLFGNRDEREFLSNPGRWQDRVGDPYQLERYSVRVAHARRCFERFHDLVQGPEDRSPFYDDWTERGPVIDGLLALLHDLGPLDGVAGIIDVVHRGIEEPEPPELDLYRYYLELKALTEIFYDVDELGISVPTRTLRTVTASLSNEMSISWRISNADMLIEAQPLTLNAFLWLSVFKLDGTPTNCRACRKRFDAPVGRGRPFTYCDLHRADKFKKMVKRGTIERWLEQNEPVSGPVGSAPSGPAAADPLPQLRDSALDHLAIVAH